MEHLILLGHTTLRLLLALCIGGGIGWERARSHHPAGVRTHMLVTIGAAVVMLLGSQTVGVFVGAGQYIISLCGFAVAMLALRLFKFPRFEISFLCSQQGDCFHTICKTLNLQEANISNFSSRDVDGEHSRVRFELYLGMHGRDVSTSDLLLQLSSIPQVSSINIDAL